MNGEHHPAPHRDELPPLMASVLLYTGPAAWLVQLCVAFILTSWPCYPNMERRNSPLPGYGWAPTAALVIMLLGAAIAFISGVIAARRYRAVRGEREGGHATLAEVGQGRTRFIALWAVYLGFGSAAMSVLTLIGFTMVPRCLG